jgi:hypothetical protein
MSQSLTYHQLNKERIAPQKKAWAQANRDKINKANREWRARNKESVLKKQRDYYHHGAYHNKLWQKFNVMKGEIMIGNDSLELLQEFKELLTEMHQQGLLDEDEFNKLNDLIE